MKTNHTPGPWKVDEARTGPYGDYDSSIIARDGLTYIGTITGDDRHGTADQYDAAVPAQEAHANARLIAAAPELLAALKHLIRDGGPGDFPTAEAAIAKAEGKGI